MTIKYGLAIKWRCKECHKTWRVYEYEKIFDENPRHERAASLRYLLRNYIKPAKGIKPVKPVNPFNFIDISDCLGHRAKINHVEGTYIINKDGRENGTTIATSQ